MSKEPGVVSERLRFVSRTSKPDDNYHRDTYQVTQIDNRSKQIIWVGQRIYTVFKRIGKTRDDKRSGAYGARFRNRQQDPSRASKSS